MFTGLVEAKSIIHRMEPEPAGVRLIIQRPAVFTDISIGDSVAINGCCLTVVAQAHDTLDFQAGSETLSRTNLGLQKIGSAVNCERSMRLGERVGGHLVSGHVDGLGRLALREDDDAWSRMVFDASPQLTSQMASKGSIAVDGVSLTLVEVGNTSFSVALIPFTLQHSTLGDLQSGDAVNLETDLLAKYVQRQLEVAHRIGSHAD